MDLNGCGRCGQGKSQPPRWCVRWSRTAGCCEPDSVRVDSRAGKMKLKHKYWIETPFKGLSPFLD